MISKAKAMVSTKIERRTVGPIQLPRVATLLVYDRSKLFFCILLTPLNTETQVGRSKAASKLIRV